jgi:hypothetical protein
LIKTNAQAIPAYLMGFFKLPIWICDDLTRMVRNYWWASTDGKGKLTGNLGIISLNQKYKVDWVSVILEYSTKPFSQDRRGASLLILTTYVHDSLKLVITLRGNCRTRCSRIMPHRHGRLSSKALSFWKKALYGGSVMARVCVFGRIPGFLALFHTGLF